MQELNTYEDTAGDISNVIQSKPWALQFHSQKWNAKYHYAKPYAIMSQTI